MNRLLIVASGLFVIAGCSQITHKKRVHTSGSGQASNNVGLKEVGDTQLVKELEAKLMDIPIPLEVKPINSCFSQDPHEDSCSLGYCVNSTTEDIEQFYLQEMDRLGWKKTFSIHGFEDLIGFEKPTRFSLISLRPDPKVDTIRLIIFTGKR